MSAKSQQQATLRQSGTMMIDVVVSYSLDFFDVVSQCCYLVEVYDKPVPVTRKEALEYCVLAFQYGFQPGDEYDFAPGLEERIQESISRLFPEMKNGKRTL